METGEEAAWNSGHPVSCEDRCQSDYRVLQLQLSGPLQDNSEPGPHSILPSYGGR